MQPKTHGYLRTVLLLVLFTVVALFFLMPGVRTAFFAMRMIFVQRSVHTLIGSIKSAQFGGLYAIWLTVFQSLLLPFFNPLIFIANSTVFGMIPGAVVSFSGTVLGGMACYAVGRILLGDVLVRFFQLKLKPHQNKVYACLILALAACFPSIYPVCCYMAGMMNLSASEIAGISLLARIPVIAAYSFYTSPFSTLLPSYGRGMLAVFGLAMAAVWWLLTSKYAKKTTLQR